MLICVLQPDHSNLLQIGLPATVQILGNDCHVIGLVMFRAMGQQNLTKTICITLVFVAQKIYVVIVTLSFSFPGIIHNFFQRNYAIMPTIWSAGIKFFVCIT